jgi:hypothetical protein
MRKDNSGDATLRERRIAPAPFQQQKPREHRKR